METLIKKVEKMEVPFSGDLLELLQEILDQDSSFWVFETNSFLILKVKSVKSEVSFILGEGLICFFDPDDKVSWVVTSEGISRHAGVEKTPKTIPLLDFSPLAEEIATELGIQL